MIKLAGACLKNKGNWGTRREDEIEGGGKPFMRAVEKGFQGELTVS